MCTYSTSSTVYLLFWAKAHLVPRSLVCESLGHSLHTVIEIEGETMKIEGKKDRNVDIIVNLEHDYIKK